MIETTARVLQNNCRLCGGQASWVFSACVLRSLDVSYFECGNCGALQTEHPYWLDEAYAEHLAVTDTGAAQRNLRNLSVVYAICRILSIRNVLDAGGGDGLLCRLLRDYGINCFVEDKFATPTYARGFTAPDFLTPDLLLAFDVFEHFAEPRREIEQLLASHPSVLLLSTTPYCGQGENWWFLAPESGQHVFFYSPESLRLIARTHGYDLILEAPYALFTRQGSCPWLQRLLCTLSLGTTFCRFMRSLLAWVPARGVLRDQAALTEARRIAPQSS